MWNFDASMLLVDLLCYATAAALIVAAFRVLDYAEGRRGRPLSTANWYRLVPSKPGRPVHLAHVSRESTRAAEGAATSAA